MPGRDCTGIAGWGLCFEGDVATASRGPHEGPSGDTIVEKSARKTTAAATATAAFLSLSLFVSLYPCGFHPSVPVSLSLGLSPSREVSVHRRDSG